MFGGHRDTAGPCEGIAAEERIRPAGRFFRREALQDRWRAGGGTLPDTEELRVTIQGYRALLFGLLTA